jgi:NADH-quinone oxidoreductase subunit E
LARLGAVTTAARVVGAPDGVAGAATLVGLRLAEEHGVSVAEYDPQTPISSSEQPAPVGVSEAHKPASDRKPAGDAPLPQEEKAKEARG